MTAPAIAPGAPDIQRFIEDTGRYPRIGDPVQPWEYRGWALPYILDAPRVLPDIPDRWGYLAETRAAGRLLDAPIPRIEFASAHATDRLAILKQVMKWIEIADRYEGGWSSFMRLIEWLAWSMGVSIERPRLRDGADEALYRGVNLIPLLQTPSDYLGTILAEHKGNGKAWNPNGFYPTPHEVCEMMTRMLVDCAEGEDMRTKSVCDPCVGTGRMLLHASNYSMNLYGCDIDPTVCAITKINGVLYAPWIVCPLPAVILGREVPPPPPAPLPVPPEYQPPENVVMFRCDDRGQGLLFDSPVESPRPAKTTQRKSTRKVQPK
jgi:hypothetical protein